MGVFTPEAFGKYYLVDKIAVGGMAEIFKAKSFSHAGFEKLLVIKRILQHHSENEEFVTMFIDEAKISAQLQHPNIVHVYDFGKLHANCYIAMECVEGKDAKRVLKKLSERRKLLPIEFALFIAHEVALALDHAHTKTNIEGQPLGIVHRDMSPANVLVSYAGEVKLADFGIAKADFSGYDTEVGVLKGKFEYMSPEQARGESVTQSSDLFSLGIILYELLTSRRLFKAKTEIATLEKIKKLDFKPPSAYNPAVSEELDAIVLKALQQEPGERYQSAHDFQHALHDLLHTDFEPQPKRRLADFLSELFEDEQSAERNALQEGSRIALELHEADDEIELQPEWEESPSHGGPTLRTQTSKRPILGILLAFASLAAILLAILVNVRTTPPPPQITPAAPTHGEVNILLEPVETQVFNGDQLLGTGPRLDLKGLEPGSLTLRFEAEGYLNIEETLEVTVGEPYILPIRLVEEVEQEVATRTSRVLFESTPSGAQVFVDNRAVGITPITYSEGNANTVYKVRYLLDGHRPLVFEVTTAGPDERITETRTLQAKVAGVGGLNVSMRRGWAYIYIDGNKMGETPDTITGLTAGKHEVRVVNEPAGIDRTQTVLVRPNETATVFFEPQ
ncbi:MAG: serine/threonine-protein kinase [Myxococcota bacterium]|nr:serine/threonine-protein kinase [Myxococcota bacterium]